MRRPIRRLSYLLISAVAVMTMTVMAFASFAPRLIWNATASAPVGLYVVRPMNGLEHGTLVVVYPPKATADWLTARGYLPPDTPLLKHISALAGQTVCRADLDITVDGMKVGSALRRDRLHRPLPEWQGCHRLRDGEIFLMNADVPDSLDGRYFGRVPANSIIGQAVPLWVDTDADGRFEWHPKPH